jgi:hypothetical protein
MLLGGEDFFETKGKIHVIPWVKKYSLKRGNSQLICLELRWHISLFW